MKSDVRCRGSWLIGNACGVCGRCKREAIAATSERDELRKAMETLAESLDQFDLSSLAKHVRDTARAIREKWEGKVNA